MECANNTQSFDIKVKNELQTDDFDSKEKNFCKNIEKIEQVLIKVENTGEDFSVESPSHEEINIKKELDFNQGDPQENFEAKQFLESNFSTGAESIAGPSSTASKNDPEPTTEMHTQKKDILRNRQSNIDKVCSRKKQNKNDYINTTEKSNSRKSIDQRDNIVTIIHSCEKSYTCDVCRKTFDRKYNLNKHKRIHTGEKIYKCNVCKKTSTNRIAFKIHKKDHKVQKVNKCDICQRQFPFPSELRRHKRIHSGEKPYACEVCEKTFSDKGNLIQHKRIHTDEKPYACEICQKQFISTSKLNRHKFIHSGEKPYACEICEKSFNRNSNLINHHKRIHSAERPYSCDVCQRQYIALYDLNRHKLTHND